jgi:hypothetical protein
MVVFLNKDQAKALADFFLSIAKGLILGGIGFTTIAPAEFKLLYAFFAMIFAFFCINLALEL